MPRPHHWRVTVATDDAKILELTINAETGQLFLAVSESGRAPSHVATFGHKTSSLDNLIESLLEGADELDSVTAPPANDADDGARYVEKGPQP